MRKFYKNGTFWISVIWFILMCYGWASAEELSFSLSVRNPKIETSFDYEISAGIEDEYKDLEFSWEREDGIYYYAHSLEFFPFEWIDFEWERKDSSEIENFITSLNYPSGNYKIKLLLDNNIITDETRVLGGFEAKFKIFKFKYATDFREYDLFSFYAGKKIKIGKNFFIEPFYEAKKFGDKSIWQGKVKLIYKLVKKEKAIPKKWGSFNWK